MLIVASSASCPADCLIGADTRNSFSLPLCLRQRANLDARAVRSSIDACGFAGACGQSGQ